jgi:hypothetical protein
MTRSQVKNLSRRVDELAARRGLSRSRPILVYGPTRAEAEHNAAEYLALHPEDADRPVRLIVHWGGEPSSLPTQPPIHVQEIAAGTWVSRDRRHSDRATR